jgi:putative ABC transport system substrate-binding protein
MIPRRAVALGIAGAILATPLARAAQQSAKIPVVGVLQAAPFRGDPTQSEFVVSFRELGYEDGRNVRLVLRSAEAHLDRLPGLVAELVQMKADVIVAFGTPTTRAAIDASKMVPIAMFVGDPIGSGFVGSLARPGGNVTGVSNNMGDIAAKRVQLLNELAPAARRIAVLYNSDDPVTASQLRETERAAPQLAVEVRFFPVRAEDRLIAAFQELLEWKAEGLLWLSGQERPFIPATIDFAAKHRLPMMVPRREQVEAGGLICYYPVQSELNRRLAAQVDKILKGAKPGDLPVEQPTRFDLVINLKTAAGLGLTVPQSLLARADKVIE